MKTIRLDRKKSEKLFYEIRRLGLFLTNLSGVVQNPNFATSHDLDSFKEDCKKFETEYSSMKVEIENLFESAE